MSTSELARAALERQFIESLPIIERTVAFVTRRYHLSADAAEDFASSVKVKILEDDYGILRKFKGNSSLQTYLVVVVKRLFLDQRAAAWGKWRPSAAARRLGPLALQLELRHVRDGLPLDQAIETMLADRSLEATREQLYALSVQLPRRVTRRFETDDVLEGIPAPAIGADRQVAFARDDRMARVQATLHDVAAGLAPQDRLVLRMRFSDNVSVADISRVLRVDQSSLYRRIEGHLRTMRKALEDAGLRADDIMDLLERPEIELGFWPPENSDSGPSLSEGASS